MFTIFYIISLIIFVCFFIGAAPILVGIVSFLWFISLHKPGVAILVAVRLNGWLNGRLLAGTAAVNCSNDESDCWRGRLCYFVLSLLV